MGIFAYLLTLGRSQLRTSWSSPLPELPHCSPSKRLLQQSGGCGGLCAILHLRRFFLSGREKKQTPRHQPPALDQAERPTSFIYEQRVNPACLFPQVWICSSLHCSKSTCVDIDTCSVVGSPIFSTQVGPPPKRTLFGVVRSEVVLISMMFCRCSTLRQVTETSTKQPN